MLNTLHIVYYYRFGRQNFSKESKIENIFSFVDYKFSVATTQLCCCRIAINNRYIKSSGYVPIKLCLQKQVADEIWPVDCSLLNLEINKAEISILPHDINNYFYIINS